MSKIGRILRYWDKLLLVLAIILASIFIGYRYGESTVKLELEEFANNVYGGKYYVDLDFTGGDGQKNTITLSSSGFRLPMHDSKGNRYVKVAMPFIEWKDVPYDISHFALTDGNASSGFDFSFIGAPPPDDIFVQCWPREYHGTVGKFTNGEPVDFESTAIPTKFHVSDFKAGYIYSIYAAWGPYYGEYACLASENPNERVYWTLAE